MSDPTKIIFTKEQHKLLQRRWTADLHFGHKNIIRYCNRPFVDVPQQDAKQIENWNADVNEFTETIVVGDFAFASFERQKQILKQLKGRKVLVRGNHDENPMNLYLDLGWDEVICDIWITKLANGRTIGVAHDPAKSVMDRSMPWVVGHLHDLFTLYGNCLNVGVDVHNFTPISETKVIEYITRMQFK